MRMTGETVMFQVQLGQAPSYFWFCLAAALLILVAALAASRVLRALATFIDARGRVKVALAYLQANTEKSTPSKRTASK
jgi:hypothetical protein